MYGISTDLLRLALMLHTKSNPLSEIQKGQERVGEDQILALFVLFKVQSHDC